MKLFTYSLHLVIFSTLISTGATAQNFTMGIYQDEKSSELTSSDPMLTGDYHYRDMQLQLSAGEGVLLYMTSGDFTPLMYTVDTTLVNWVKGQEGTGTSFIIITAHSDTVFHVVYTSTTALATGNFTFGMRKLSKEQMEFNENLPFCSRFAYLLNQWQCYFRLIPATEGRTTDQINTTRTLFPGDNGIISNVTHYKEYLFQTADNDDAVSAKYKEVVNQITNCLPENVFEIKTEILDDQIGDGGTMIITYFNLKGNASETTLASFSVTYSEQFGFTDTVYLEFF